MNNINGSSRHSCPNPMNSLIIFRLKITSPHQTKGKTKKSFIPILKTRTGITKNMLQYNNEGSWIYPCPIGQPVQQFQYITHGKAKYFIPLPIIVPLPDRVNIRLESNFNQRSQLPPDKSFCRTGESCIYKCNFQSRGFQESECFRSG